MGTVRRKGRKRIIQAYGNSDLLSTLPKSCTGASKRGIVECLEKHNIPFIDVGMGVELVDESLHGILRVTASTKKQRAHVHKKNRIPFSEGDENNEYSRNIQVADLNALNATLAVIKWKKMFGFYRDLEGEHFITYTIDGNTLINEDLSL